MIDETRDIIRGILKQQGKSDEDIARLERMLEETRPLFDAVEAQQRANREATRRIASLMQEHQMQHAGDIKINPEMCLVWAEAARHIKALT